MPNLLRKNLKTNKDYDGLLIRSEVKVTPDIIEAATILNS